MSITFLIPIYNEVRTVRKAIEEAININIPSKEIIIIDNGSGFGSFSNNLNEILNPYVTTKKNGTGLGLSIVNKIINDHNGKLNFVAIPYGAKVEIIFN